MLVLVRTSLLFSPPALVLCVAVEIFLGTEQSNIVGNEEDESLLVLWFWSLVPKAGGVLEENFCCCSKLRECPGQRGWWIRVIRRIKVSRGEYQRTENRTRAMTDKITILENIDNDDAIIVDRHSIQVGSNP